MRNRPLLVVWRLLLGGATLFAAVYQAVILAHNHVFNPVNYLGYFTNLSNIVAAGILIISAFYVLGGRKPSPKDDLIRGAATLYMAITGIVYVTLLTGEDLGLLQPWINILFHIVMPVAVVADWLYRPPRSALTVKHASSWLAFPFVFLVYSLIRGAIVGWYPYPFLDPGKAGGYAGVVVYCNGILAAFCFVGLGIMLAGNALRRRIKRAQ
jgi:hypothetical protein